MDNCFEISEKKLENMIFEYLTEDANYIGFEDIGTEHDICLRQFDLSPFGIADIITIGNDGPDDFIQVNIYELKKGNIDKNALVQIFKYKNAMEEYCSHCGLDVSEWNLYLIGGGISSDGLFELAIKSINELHVYVYDIDSRGIVLKEADYSFKNLSIKKNIKELMVCNDYDDHDESCMIINDMEESRKQGLL